MTRVAVYKSDHAAYPHAAPFHPSCRYPETLFPDVGKENAAYEAVRNVFRIAGLDIENFGAERWNPLANYMRPHQTVLLKPNLVKEYHPRDQSGWQYVITNGAVIRAIADYVWKALHGKGTVIVADAPQTDSSFAKMVRLLGLDAMQQFYTARGFDFRVYDLRQQEWVNRDGVITSRSRLAGDPEGFVAFDLSCNSEFEGHSGCGRFYGADYNSAEVNAHHTGGRHEYLIAASAICCDVIFSLPKWKTHKKAGITVSLKNLVGVNGDKNWLPHHTEGDPRHGGDEHPAPKTKHQLERKLVAIARNASWRAPVLAVPLHRVARGIGKKVFGDTEQVIRSGNWWGNDTLWRMCLDLNKIVLYGNRDGSLREPVPGNRKPHLVLVDGIIAGEGSGPMNPDPVSAGVVAFGVDPPCVDAACAYLMGFDADRIPIVRQAFRCRNYPLTSTRDWRDVCLVSNYAGWNGKLIEIDDQCTFHFKPHFGWDGQIVRNARRVG